MTNISFLGREAMLINAAKYAAKTAEAHEAELAKIAETRKAIEESVVKASSILYDTSNANIKPYIADDLPVMVGNIVNQLA